MNNLNLNTDIEINPTGGDLINNSLAIVSCKVGEYIVTVKINEKNEFLGIQNVAMEKIFYSHQSVKGNFDVSKYYEEATE